ncbi:MAG: class I SAM-dependent RNA methyltransferase [Clostridia bacterium]|nr:class I SAM-dependent RNA methyltransferase [Clostridia bacterium]
MSKFELVCPCMLGVEGLVAQELRDNGMENVRPENGKVVFSGGFEEIARANITSRYSERVQILLGTFYAESFDMLFEAVKKLPWEEFIGRSDTFPVKGRSLSSKLTSIPDCQKIIKKAVVERLKQSYHMDWFPEEGPVHQIQFLILKDKCSIMLDTSGEGLHKRGYRKKSTEAPIKETLAAAMCNIARVRTDATFYDPFCGSGTILIEAAMMAHNIAPGIRRHFASEKWGVMSNQIWEQERTRARDLINKEAEFQAYGFDLDPSAVELAQSNAIKAGVSKKIHLSVADVKDFAPDTQYGCVVTNPPYGERLLDIKGAQAIYKTMGKVFERKPGWSYTIISPDEDFERCFGKSADKRRKLYNGMIRCQVYQYFKNK